MAARALHVANAIALFLAATWTTYRTILTGAPEERVQDRAAASSVHAVERRGIRTPLF